jgi:hypothetical protein
MWEPLSLWFENAPIRLVPGWLWPKIVIGPDMSLTDIAIAVRPDEPAYTRVANAVAA